MSDENSQAKGWHSIVLVVGDESLLTEDLVNSLNETGNGADLVIGTWSESLRERIYDRVPDAEVFVSGLEWLHGANQHEDEAVIGRLMLADRTTLLVSSIDLKTKEEHAVFGHGFGNGLVVIARRLMATGMVSNHEPGRDR